MNKLCDLHTHSTFSDGTLTPTEIIDAATHIGLSAVALCDHNTVDGLPEFLAAAKSKPVEAIPGAEFSVDYDGTELHLLALYIPEKRFGQISQLMVSVNHRKERSNIELVNSLNKAGYLIDYDTIKSGSPNAKINRAHIAAELTRKGYTSSVKEAFDTLLAPEKGFYREPRRVTFWEMLDVIKAIAAVPVLAHPFLNLSEEELANFLPKAKAAGLVGMECLYSSYDSYETEKSLELAAAFKLAKSGGSDFHGDTKPDIKLGLGKGNLAIPYTWTVDLKR